MPTPDGVDSRKSMKTYVLTLVPEHCIVKVNILRMKRDPGDVDILCHMRKKYCRENSSVYLADLVDIALQERRLI